MNKLGDSKISEKERAALEKQLVSAMADAVCAEIIKRNGSAPNNMEAKEFSKRMSQDPSFRSVAKPLIQNVLNDYNNFKKNPDAGNWGADAVNKMVDDHSIIGAATANQKLVQGMSPEQIKDQIERGVETPGSRQMQRRYNEIKKELKRENREKEMMAAGQDAMVLKPQDPPV